MQKTITLALLLACGTAHASDWVEILHVSGAIMVEYLDVSRPPIFWGHS
jgi:hypothetical protein